MSDVSMCSALHLFVLNVRCQVLVHFVSWSMSCWSYTLSLAVLRGVYIFVSSANIWTKLLIALSVITNRSGPRTLPWGMPLCTGDQLDREPLTVTSCLLSNRNWRVQRSTLPPTP